ncbi:hypothetical protein ACFXTH_016961 [Malus domestica]
MHLLQLMTSWAVVCNVWYLEPQNIRPGETAIEFAERARDIISVRAGLKMVPWDEYLKYSRPSPKHRERKQQSIAETMLRRLDEKLNMFFSLLVDLLQHVMHVPHSISSSYELLVMMLDKKLHFL